jgi:ParB-like chromosome segregation protein Spo0J
MTSAEFTSFPIDNITVDRAVRQRRQLTNIDQLADSISRTGLINPIVVDKGGNLIAGERRLEACRNLGWTRSRSNSSRTCQRMNGI